MDRAGHYFGNWNDLLDNWMKKVKANIAEMEALRFDDLPEVVPVDWSRAALASTIRFPLSEAYDKASSFCTGPGITTSNSSTSAMQPITISSAS